MASRLARFQGPTSNSATVLLPIAPFTEHRALSSRPRPGEGLHAGGQTPGRDTPGWKCAGSRNMLGLPGFEYESAHEVLTVPAQDAAATHVQGGK